MTKFFARFSCAESGATAIEYALIAVLIAVAVIGGATALGTALNSTLQTDGNVVTSAGS
jgi:pilus assembly protein Flp/PilA